MSGDQEDGGSSQTFPDQSDTETSSSLKTSKTALEQGETDVPLWSLDADFMLPTVLKQYDNQGILRDVEAMTSMMQYNSLGDVAYVEAAACLSGPPGLCLGEGANEEVRPPTRTPTPASEEASSFAYFEQPQGVAQPRQASRQVHSKDKWAQQASGQTFVIAVTQEVMEDHATGTCRPCAYYWHKWDGCRKGDQCEYCHLCGVTERYRKKREARKAKRVALRMSAFQADGAGVGAGAGIEYIDTKDV